MKPSLQQRIDARRAQCRTQKEEHDRRQKSAIEQSRKVARLTAENEKLNAIYAAETEHADKVERKHRDSIIELRARVKYLEECCAARDAELSTRCMGFFRGDCAGCCTRLAGKDIRCPKKAYPTEQQEKR